MVTDGDKRKLNFSSPSTDYVDEYDDNEDGDGEDEDDEGDEEEGEGSSESSSAMNSSVRQHYPPSSLNINDAIQILLSNCGPLPIGGLQNGRDRSGIDRAVSSNETPGGKPKKARKESQAQPGLGTSTNGLDRQRVLREAMQAAAIQRKCSQGRRKQLRSVGGQQLSDSLISTLQGS